MRERSCRTCRRADIFSNLPICASCIVCYRPEDGDKGKFKDYWIPRAFVKAARAEKEKT
jgi:hypothetical protein